MVTEVAIPTVISEGGKIRGDLLFVSPTEIFGLVEGNLTQQCLETLRVGRTGWIHGSIYSQGPVVVEGRVTGNITSETRVTLSATASVQGEILAPSIEISAGALVDGDFKMAENKPKEARRAA